MWLARCWRLLLTQQGFVAGMPDALVDAAIGESEEGSVCAPLETGSDSEEHGSGKQQHAEPCCPGPASHNNANAHLHQPLYPSCSLALIEVAHYLQSFRQRFRVSEAAMAALLAFIVDILPAGHFLPPTLHRLSRLVEADNAQKRVRHVCVREQCGHMHVWDYF
jgi:hypothetical protein